MIHFIHPATLRDILDLACEKAIELMVDDRKEFNGHHIEPIMDEITEIKAKLDVYDITKPYGENLKIC